MQIEWSVSARDDIRRLYHFLLSVHPDAAEKSVIDIRRYVHFLYDQPRLGRQLPRYAPREVRSGIIGRYEVRYEIQASRIIILRVWHMRENRE